MIVVGAEEIRAVVVVVKTFGAFSSFRLCNLVFWEICWRVGTSALSALLLCNHLRKRPYSLRKDGSMAIGDFVVVVVVVV